MNHWIKKIFVLGLSTAFFSGLPGAEAAPEVPENIFKWIQSTSRADYYFNKEQICFAVDAEGYIDLNRLIVPTLKVYDSVQIEDVVSKRRWRMQDMTGYDSLVGAADYLEFNLSGKTVKVTEHDDLDEEWSTLASETNYEAVSMDSYGEKDVDGKFYRAILKYAADHQEDIIGHTKGKLREEDKTRLEEAKNPPKDDKKDKKDNDKKDKKDKKDKRK
ncbi:MAG: hypothetical protein IKH16_11025 [Selenomonadaceae bacterium]|nr:hypothetical protein [Selenomonadaceae bacterium]